MFALRDELVPATSSGPLRSLALEVDWPRGRESEKDHGSSPI